MVYQDPVGSLDRLWTIGRCLAEPLVAIGRAPVAGEIEAMLRHVRLAHLAPDTKVRTLSVGQAQRVALARALMANPKAILADEPTSALDPTNAATIVRLLHAAARAGAAVLVVSHHQRLLASFCDRLLTLQPEPNGHRIGSVMIRADIAELVI